MKLEKIFYGTLLCIQCFIYGLCLFGTKKNLDELSFKEETTCSITSVESLKPWQPGITFTSSTLHSKPCTLPVSQSSEAAQTTCSTTWYETYQTSLSTDVPQQSTPGEESQMIVEEPVQNIQNSVCETECQYVESQGPTQEQETSSTNYSNSTTENPSANVSESQSDTAQTSTGIINYTWTSYSDYLNNIVDGNYVEEWQLHGMTEDQIICLRRLVCNEDGSYWVSVERKANIVACVMRGIETTGWSFDTWIANQCEPWGFSRWWDREMDKTIVDAVDYYFEHKDDIYADWPYNGWHAYNGTTYYDIW